MMWPSRTITQPIIEKRDPDAFPVLTVALTAGKPLRDITEYADKVLRRRLESSEGVGQVLVVGGRQRQLNVWLDAEQLFAHAVAPIVDVSDSANRAVINRDIIDTIPAARIATALSALLPGVQTLGLGDPVGRQQLQFAIHGSRTGEQTTTIDGFSNRLALGVGGATSTHYNNQATVQETTVTTSGGSAEPQFGGIWTNIIPREGGNTFRGQLFAAFGNEDLASSNLNDDLRSRGIQNVAGLKKLWDFNPAIGGPIVRDRLWFYSSYRNSSVSQYRAGIYYNLTPTAWAYTPDTTRPAFVEVTDGSYSARLTWQASARNKLNLYYDLQPHVVTHRNFDSLTSPEATNYTPYQPNYFTQAVWKSPVTNKLLLEAGVGGTSIDYNARLQTGQDPGVVVVPGTVTAVESATGMRFRAPASGAVDQAPEIVRARPSPFVREVGVTQIAHAAGLRADHGGQEHESTEHARAVRDRRNEEAAVLHERHVREIERALVLDRQGQETRLGLWRPHLQHTRSPHYRTGRPTRAASETESPSKRSRVFRLPPTSRRA